MTPAEPGNLCNSNHIRAKVPTRPVIADQWLIRSSSKALSDIPTNENPGARAGELLKQVEPATGAHRKNDGGDTLSRKQAAANAGMSERQKNTARQTLSAMSKFGSPAHKSASRMLYYALTLGDFDTWAAFRAIAVMRLSRLERASLAYAALSSLCDHDGYLVASTVLFGLDEGGAGHGEG